METQITQTEFKLNDMVEIIDVRWSVLVEDEVGLKGEIIKMYTSITGMIKYKVELSIGHFWLDNTNIKLITKS